MVGGGGIKRSALGSAVSPRADRSGDRFRRTSITIHRVIRAQDNVDLEARITEPFTHDCIST